jgi:hypothetical protein
MRLASFLASLSLLVACSSSPSASTSTTLQGSFSCGSATCDLATQACNEIWDGVSTSVYAYICDDLPAPCLSEHTCQCAEQQGLTELGQCAEDSDGALILSNQLP